MAIQRTLVLCKPDAVQRGVVGQIIARFERKGLKIAGLKMVIVDEKLASRHYAEHLNKPFYPELKAFITSCPVIAIAIEGENAVEIVRSMMGNTNCRLAEPGTIRGDLGIGLTMNLVHGSDSLASAEREISLFFEPDELFGYELTAREWM